MHIKWVGVMGICCARPIHPSCKHDKVHELIVRQDIETLDLQMIYFSDFFRLNLEKGGTLKRMTVQEGFSIRSVVHVVQIEKILHKFYLKNRYLNIKVHNFLIFLWKRFRTKLIFLLANNTVFFFKTCFTFSILVSNPRI